LLLCCCSCCCYFFFSLSILFAFSHGSDVQFYLNKHKLGRTPLAKVDDIDYDDRYGTEVDLLLFLGFFFLTFFCFECGSLFFSADFPLFLTCSEEAEWECEDAEDLQGDGEDVTTDSEASHFEEKNEYDLDEEGVVPDEYLSDGEGIKSVSDEENEEDDGTTCLLVYLSSCLLAFFLYFFFLSVFLWFHRALIYMSRFSRLDPLLSKLNLSTKPSPTPSDKAKSLLALKEKTIANLKKKDSKLVTSKFYDFRFYPEIATNDLMNNAIKIYNSCTMMQIVKLCMFFLSSFNHM
jgi:hypothetical protein